jgi:hypothetical protein
MIIERKQHGEPSYANAKFDSFTYNEEITYLIFLGSQVASLQY